MAGAERSFTRRLREEGAPDGSRTFRRFPQGPACVQIINVQVESKKALEHHCAPALRQRLGFLIPSRLRALERLPIVGLLFRPRDTWWAADDVTAIVAAREAVIAHGLPWLETHTPGEAGSSWR